MVTVTNSAIESETPVAAVTLTAGKKTDWLDGVSSAAKTGVEIGVMVGVVVGIVALVGCATSYLPMGGNTHSE